MSRVFEDFVPISGSRALLTTGSRLDELDAVELCDYRLADGRVEIGERIAQIASGSRVRLGGVFDGELLYSDAHGIIGRPDLGATAHQPFKHLGSLYYTDGPLEAVALFCDGAPLPFAFAGMVQIGNPCWSADALYFEARSDPAPDRPDLWRICRWRPDSGAEPEVLWPGANPAYHDGRLFWGEWNGRAFDYRSVEVA